MTDEQIVDLANIVLRIFLSSTEEFEALKQTFDEKFSQLAPSDHLKVLMAYNLFGGRPCGIITDNPETARHFRSFASHHHHGGRGSRRPHPPLLAPTDNIVMKASEHERTK
jgi:hypothetical protein